MKFQLGQIVMTIGVSELLTDVQIAPMIDRHAAGDWGEVDAHDRRANDRAIKDGTRLLSAYTANGTKFWVITEADRSVTTVLLPSEY